MPLGWDLALTLQQNMEFVPGLNSRQDWVRQRSSKAKAGLLVNVLVEVQIPHLVVPKVNLASHVNASSILGAIERQNWILHGRI